VYDEFDGIVGEIIEATQPRDFPVGSSDRMIETLARKGWPASAPYSKVP
jgi:hypothetical protein